MFVFYLHEHAERFGSRSLEYRTHTMQTAPTNASAPGDVGATRTLYRPVGPKELKLISESGFRAFPPRLSDQPIFYPVLNEEYARQIARDWNVPASGSGFVTRFEVDAQFLSAYPVQVVGGAVHEELWIPAEDLPELNRHIAGQIEIIAEYHKTEVKP